jgi:hypothetical protein
MPHAGEPKKITSANLTQTFAHNDAAVSSRLLCGCERALLIYKSDKSPRFRSGENSFTSPLDVGHIAGNLCRFHHFVVLMLAWESAAQSGTR